MLNFIFKRLLQAIPVLLIVITITFTLIHAAPGGPFSAERAVPPEVIEALNAQYNLDDPAHIQFFIYLKNIAQGDFGPSFKYTGRSVTEIIGAGMPVTFELGMYSILIALVLGISAGVIASPAVSENGFGVVASTVHADRLSAIGTVGTYVLHA